MTERPLMTVDELQRMLEDAFPESQLRYAVDDVTATTLRMRSIIGPADGRPGGTVAGPTVMALADCAAWMVIVAQIGPVALSVTTSLHIDFVRRPRLADLVAEAALLKLGSRLAVAEVAISTEGGPLVAKAQVTYSIPPGSPPPGSPSGPTTR